MPECYAAADEEVVFVQPFVSMNEEKMLQFAQEQLSLTQLVTWIAATHRLNIYFPSSTITVSVYPSWFGSIFLGHG